jgi:lysophospholipase L1-like esterase
MTAGSGTAISVAYPPRLANMTNRFVSNFGSGGQTSTQITARVVADVSNDLRYINIFWMGTNDSTGDGSPAAMATWKSTMLANIATSVAKVQGNNRYLVCGIVIIEGGFLSSNQSYLTDLDATMSSLYGERFVDIRAYLQSKNDGSANDLADIAAGLVPRSLRSDTIHCNDKGYQLVAECYQAKLASLGWIDG